MTSTFLDAVEPRFPAMPSLAAKARAENFPVASRLLPRRLRRHLLAVYAFARLVDDVGDEMADPVGLLDQIEADLLRIPTGEPRLPAVRAVAATVREVALPVAPLHKLVAANRQDQVVTRYATWSELHDYCRLSADPVGAIVLGLFGAATPSRLAWSNSVCTGLQLVEHLQDVGQDMRRGRIYLPQQDLSWFGCAETDLTMPRSTPSLRAVVAYEAHRAHRLLAEGAPLVRSLRGWARLAVAGYVAGGSAVLHALRRANYDVLGSDVRPRRGRIVSEATRLLAGGVPR